MSTTNSDGAHNDPDAKPVCRDLATARKLIAQMRGEQDGRPPSTRRDAQSPNYDVPEVGALWNLVRPYEAANVREWNPPTPSRACF